MIVAERAPQSRGSGIRNVPFAPLRVWNDAFSLRQMILAPATASRHR